MAALALNAAAPATMSPRPSPRPSRPTTSSPRHPPSRPTTPTTPSPAHSSPTSTPLSTTSTTSAPEVVKSILQQKKCAAWLLRGSGRGPHAPYTTARWREDHARALARAETDFSSVVHNAAEHTAKQGLGHEEAVRPPRPNVDLGSLRGRNRVHEVHPVITFEFGVDRVHLL